MKEGNDGMSEEPTEGSTATRSPAGLRQRRVLGVLAVLVVTLLVVGTWQWMRLQDQRSDADDRRAAVDAASAQAVTLLGISQDNVDERLARLEAGSTGDFKKQLSSIAETFGTVVEQGEVSSTGEVVSAAVADLKGPDARVLLALSSEVVNADTAEPEARAYRITVDLRKEGDQWLISGMQFAP